MRYFRLLLLSAVLALTLISCTTITRQSENIQTGTETSDTQKQSTDIIKPDTALNTKIASQGKKNAAELTDFFLSHRPDADRKQIMRMADTYIREAADEGINSDIAWVQMCNETGFLRFGRKVTPEMHNYCGLGSFDQKNLGARFATETLGIRAHIQHLHAYATPSYRQLKHQVVDPRYKYVVPRGKAPTVEKLSGTWAAEKDYADRLKKLLNELKKY